MGAGAKVRRYPLLPVALFTYLTAALAASWYFRSRTLDYRGLEVGRLDFAWQLELAWQALHGHWVGRDLTHARGPLWQLVATLGLGDTTRLAPAVASIELAFRTLGVAAASGIAFLTLERSRERLLGALLLASLAFGAGIATFRGLLSLAIIVSFAPARERSRLGPWLAGVCIALAAWLSVDRALLGVASVFAMVVYEALACWRRRASLGPLLWRVRSVALGFLVTTVAASSVALALGFSPLGYVRDQRALADAYVALSAPWGAGVRMQNVIALLVVAATLSLLPLLVARLRFVAGQWLMGSLPCAAFALILPDAGHVYVALLPLLGTLVLTAVDSVHSRLLRTSYGLLASVALFGWFGARPGDLWLRPSIFWDAYQAARGAFHGQPDFETEVSQVVRFARESGDPCMGFAPPLTVAHALADLPGPTELSLRWSEAQRRALADKLRASSCTHYVHQLMALDSPRGSEWLLGTDFITLAEYYEREKQLAPSLLVLRRREVPLRLERRDLELKERAVTISVPGEATWHLGEAVSGDTLLRLNMALRGPNWAVRTGSMPELSYQLESKGEPLGSPRPLFHAEPNQFGDVYVAIDAASLEERWLLGTGTPRRTADRIRIWAKPRGRLHPEAVTVELTTTEAIQPPPPAPQPAEGCGPIELVHALNAGLAVPRMVAPRVEDDGFNLHPNPFPEARAEVFLPLGPCTDSCLSMDLSVRSTRGDGVEFEAHQLQSSHERPLLFSRLLRPSDSRHVEVPLREYVGNSWLRLGTLSAENSTADFAFVSNAKVDRCSSRGSVTSALERGSAKIEGGAVYVDRSGEIAFGPTGGAVRLPLTVASHTCLALELESRAEPDVTFEYVAWLVVDGVEHRLFVKHIPGGAPKERLGPIDLFDWESRAVELLLVAFSPHAPSSARGVYTRAELQPCTGG